MLCWQSDPLGYINIANSAQFKQMYQQIYTHVLIYIVTCSVGGQVLSIALHLIPWVARPSSGLFPPMNCVRTAENICYMYQQLLGFV